MICSDCGREIADNAISCQYCGKVFVSQRARAEAPSAPEQITKLNSQLKDQEAATDKAIGFRRKQRWFFYIVIAAMFVGAIMMMVNIYNNNAQTTADMANLQVKFAAKDKQLTDAQKDLDAANATLNDKNATMADYQDRLAKNTKSLADVTDKNKSLASDLALAKQALDTAQTGLTSTQAINYNLITRLGLSLSTAEINKIPIALSVSTATDTDKDGLPDELEKAIGTDELKTDTDGDGFDDKSEVEKGYNPLGPGVWATKPSEQYKNRIVLNKNNGVIYSWYVAINGKRYYLGMADNGFQFMLASQYWAVKQTL